VQGERGTKQSSPPFVVGFFPCAACDPLSRHKKTRFADIREQKAQLEISAANLRQRNLPDGDGDRGAAPGRGGGGGATRRKFAPLTNTLTGKFMAARLGNPSLPTSSTNEKESKQ
jgi:hypothetical protein